MSEIKQSNQTKDLEEKPKTYSIQEILSIGYVLLIIVGMYLEFIKYHVFGINIIEHSDFADFLIAPFKNSMLVGFAVVGSILLIISNYFYERHNLQKKKILDEENKTSSIAEPKPPSTESQPIGFQGFLFFLTLLFTSVNVGAGIGIYFTSHGEMQKKLDANITNARIDFINGNEKEVYLLGKNTSNLFYFENGKIEPVVCPIPGNIKSIRYIPKDQQKQLEE